jgi:hypothetical protein
MSNHPLKPPRPAGSAHLHYGGWPPAARSAHPIGRLVRERGRQFLTAATDRLLVDTSDLEEQPIGTMPEPSVRSGRSVFHRIGPMNLTQGVDARIGRP